MAKTNKTEEYEWLIGNVFGTVRAKNQKEACVKSLRRYLRMPYASGDYVPPINTKLKK